MKNETIITLALVVVILVLFLFKTPLARFAANLYVNTGGREAMISGGGQELNASEVPFTLVIQNTGNVKLTNIRIDTSATVPSALASAFEGKSCDELNPGEVCQLVSEPVDVEQYATEEGNNVTFQVRVLADYSSGTIDGFTTPLQLTITKEVPSLTVSITW